MSSCQMSPRVIFGKLLMITQLRFWNLIPRSVPRSHDTNHVHWKWQWWETAMGSAFGALHWITFYRECLNIPTEFSFRKGVKCGGASSRYSGRDSTRLPPCCSSQGQCFVCCVITGLAEDHPAGWHLAGRHLSWVTFSVTQDDIHPFSVTKVAHWICWLTVIALIYTYIDIGYWHQCVIWWVSIDDVKGIFI